MLDNCSGCAINLAMEAIGDLWRLVVTRAIMFGNRRNFRENELPSSDRDKIK